MQVEVKLSGLNGVLATLRSLPPELVSKRGGPVGAALRKGAVVIHKQAKANLMVSTAGALTTGLLAKNLVVTRGKAPREGKGERYLVRVRRKGYPNRAQSTSTIATAALLEYGSNQQPAEPWLRPAFASRAREAIDTIERELAKGVARIVQLLAAKNKGK